MHYNSLSDHLKNRFGCKVYKLALDGGMTCPNRDGTCGSRGCIFCASDGSGAFAQSGETVHSQIELAKKRVASKIKGGRYIAYFQNFTNTYAPVDYLRKIFEAAISHPDVAVLSVATRPDCLPGDVLDLLEELSKKKPVWVELGLQTVHEASAEYIRRGYGLEVYDEAVKNLRERGLEVITHVILGLPGESEREMLETVRYAGERSHGIKLHLLHVLKDTDLAEDYRAGKFELPTPEEYYGFIARCIRALPPHVVIHRLTGDGAKKDLIAPLWTGDKKRVMNDLHAFLKKENAVQGENYGK